MPNHHHHFLHFLHNRELNELYMSIAIKSFALSIIGVFIPIYLLQEGYLLSSVLLFFSLLALTHAVVSMPAAKMSSRFGFKHSILFSVPFLILALLGLHSLDTFKWAFYIVAMLFGLSNGLFWIGFHVDFARFSSKKNRGSQVGFTKGIGILSHALGPLIGGVLLVLVGFKLVFIGVAFLLALSVIPLFYSKDIHNPVKFSIRRLFKDQKIRDSLTFIGFGLERAVGLVAWPIFIFFFILGEQYTYLGAVITLGLFFSAAFVLVIGKFSNDYRRIILRIGAIGNSIVWFVKTFVSTVLHVFIIDSFYGMTQAMKDISFDALCYDKANKKNVVEFIVRREVIINAARAVIFFAMIFIVDLTVSFIPGGSLGSLLHLFF